MRFFYIREANIWEAGNISKEDTCEIMRVFCIGEKSEKQKISVRCHTWDYEGLLHKRNIWEANVYVKMSVRRRRNMTLGETSKKTGNLIKETWDYGFFFIGLNIWKAEDISKVSKKYLNCTFCMVSIFKHLVFNHQLITK